VGLVKLVALAVSLLALAAASSASAASPNPCTLVSPSDASTAIGVKVGKGKAQTLGLYRSCFYSKGGKSLTVQTRQIGKSDFVKSAKANPKPIVPVPGVGDSAYSAAGGTALLVWKGGTEITFLFVGVNPFVATQTDLAKNALKHL
jgi:hypothetical protein